MATNKLIELARRSQTSCTDIRLQAALSIVPNNADALTTVFATHDELLQVNRNTQQEVESHDKVTTGATIIAGVSFTPKSHGIFGDLYQFDWSQFSFRVPFVCSLAVALCLIVGVLMSHPAAGLIAGGGAMTVGFGINQRIADSRLVPMIAATFAMFVSTLIGMMVGHRGLTLLLAVSVWSFVYGLLTMRAPGISWVGQQAVVTLIVTSAFPANIHHAFQRGLLMLLGGCLQVVITSLLLHLLPELSKALSLQKSGLLLQQLQSISIPISHVKNVEYALRLAITVTLSAEVYRRLGIQSGYWIPMTALLVQKPAFYETLTRALMRVGGTFLGAVLTSFWLAHIHPDPLYLAAFATLFAFCAYATNAVNYGLFTLCLTSYIVFLLSLNQLPGTVIAHRRAICTITGGIIALLIHLDALRRYSLRKATHN